MFIESRSDDALTAQDAVLAEAVIENIEMPHAVEQRDNCGLRSDCWRKRVDGVIEVERLAAQQHDVEFFAELVGLHGRRILQRHLAVRAFDHETVAGQFGRAPWAHQESHVTAGLKQPAAKISADRAGADRKNAHAQLPYFVVLKMPATKRK